MISEEDYARVRDRVYSLQAQVDFLYKHLQLTYVPETVADEDPRIVDALKKGNLLLAMKVYREMTNANADVARDAVLGIKGRLGL
jgi:hypothetical protein